MHSKFYRTASQHANKRVLVIGNSASGHDITNDLVKSGLVTLPIYQSRRSKSRWDGAHPPEGIEWKPIIRKYDASKNVIIFDDNTVLRDIDAVIYCTGYKPSFPFWNETANRGPLYDYTENRLLNFYQHTFSQRFPNALGIVGIPRVLTFRSFEYQAIALARLFSGRNSSDLPPLKVQREWESDRAELVKRERRKFHDIQWDNGESMAWLDFLYRTAGLPRLEGQGLYPPVLDKETRWAIEHIRKYPEPGQGDSEAELEGWVLVERCKKDSLHFI